MKRFLAAACIALLAPGCGPGTPPEGDEEDGGIGGGPFRTAVKTGRDDNVGTVNAVPRAATIAALRAMPVPSSLQPDSARYTYAGSPEIQNHRLSNVTLAGYKLESDGDYHLLLEDGAGNHMIAEIVDPRRIAGSWKPQTTEAQRAFEARHPPSSTFQSTRETVTVAGIGFFDLVHGQLGAATNGIEIHPVLEICWGANCASTRASSASTADAPPGELDGAAMP
jgi:hypothetical protein